MPLHRDIFWVGRQWAVTGFGIQAIDQRLRGVFDIAITRLWDDDLADSRRATPGLNVQDFDNALTLARSRYPQAPTPAAVTSPREPPRPVETPPVAPPAPPVQLS